jgi:hypothetical protein
MLRSKMTRAEVLALAVLITVSTGCVANPRDVTDPGETGQGALLSSSQVFMGVQTIGPSDDSDNANLLVAQQASLAQTATLRSLSFYVTRAAGKVRFGVYDASGANGGPGAKKAETGELVPVVGWNTIAVVAPTTLAAGSYWLAYLPSNNGLAFRVDRSSGSARYYGFTYGPLPATYSKSPSSLICRWSFYATLDTSTSPPPPPTISSFTAAPASVAAGSSATLSWSVTGATSLSISNGMGTVTGTSVTVTPAATTTYALTASNITGGATASTTVVVTASAGIVVTVAPTVVNVAQSATQDFTASVTGTVSGQSTAVATFAPLALRTRPRAQAPRSPSRPPVCRFRLSFSTSHRR